MNNLAKHLNNIVYFLVLCCVIVVSFAVSLDTQHPFEALKTLLFQFLVLCAFFFLVVHAMLTSTFPIKKDPLHVFVLLYLSYNTLSFVLTPYADRVYFINLVLLILFFFAVVVSVNSEKKIKYFLYAIAVVVGISSTYSFFQFFGLDYAPFVNRFATRGLGTRVFSFFGNPNEFAAVLVVSLPLLLAGFFITRSRARYFLATCILLSIAGLLLTNSRAAFLGCGVSVGLFFVITLGRVHRRKYLWALCAAFILVGVGFFVSLRTGMEGSELRNSWWQNSFGIVQDHPLFGTGVGSFNVYYPAYREESTDFALRIHGNEERLQHAHNEFLEVLSDLGILGLLLFLGILAAFFRKSYVNWDSGNKYLIAGNSCAVMGLLVHNLYSINLRFVFVAMFFWLNLALQSALVATPMAEGKVTANAGKSTVNAGKIIASLLLLPFLTMIFLNHSVKVYLADSYLQEGFGFFKVQDFQAAEAPLTEAVENFPQDKWSLYYLGISQFRLERFSESEDTLIKLIQLDPNFLQSHYWLANNYFRTQDFERAKAEYREALRVNDAYRPAYFDLGLIAVIENDIEKSLEYFERVYTLKGDPATEYLRREALKNLISIHGQLGNQERVEMYALQLRQLGS